MAAESSYQYVVFARDGAGNVSAPTNQLDVTTPAAPDTEVPSAPGNLVATEVLALQVSLGWDAASDNVGVVGYDIYRGGVLVAGGAGYPPLPH